jgi:hypothetical protein
MVDREAMAGAHEIFDPIAQEHLALADTDMGRMFGTEGLRVRGKVYAFVAHEGALVVKLPSRRIDELAAAGTAVRMRMRGNELREWAELDPVLGGQGWRTVVDEARAFVDSITPHEEAE